MIPVIIILVILEGFIIKLFLKTSMELIRLFLISFSPILSGMAEYFHGMIIFRGLDKRDYMSKQFIA